MVVSKRLYVAWGIGTIAATAALLGSGPQFGKQTLAPHELNTGDAPAPIFRETPAPPNGSPNFDTAKEPHLWLVVVTKHLQQPWSVTFLPDGAMLVTERSGRLRIVRNGKLVPPPVAGVPAVQTGGPRGLQGLMDVALHPDFSDNKWVYLAYHKPTAGGEGETVLARGSWNGTALVDVHDIFESGAVDLSAIR
jgi:aldose sugar dehydrogenase